MDSARVSARNYDEALTKALIELGTTSDNVDVEIIERGTNGFLGVFGAKPWTLKVTIKKSADTEKKNSSEKKHEKQKEQKSPIEKKEVEKKETLEQKVETVVEEATVEEKETSVHSEEAVDEYAQFYGEEEPSSTSRRVLTNDELEQIRDRADAFLKDFFAAMNLPAHAVYNFSFKTNELSIVIESEEDLGVLIGKRGQTLDSLQYISAKVKKTGKFTELEPMNAYERRIIHAALQGDNMVSTKSVGEEPFRHITVYPKKNFKQNRRSPKREIQ